MLVGFRFFRMMAEGMLHKVAPYAISSWCVLLCLLPCPPSRAPLLPEVRLRVVVVAVAVSLCGSCVAAALRPLTWAGASVHRPALKAHLVCAHCFAGFSFWLRS